jgi:delta 1-pyrroline-5-carboxylate dehydrogenase
MDMNMRKEVKDLMHICERLIGFTHQNEGLTDEECEAVVYVVYYARELESEVLR